MAYLNLSPLLYPGVTHIAGAYSLHPFSEADVTTKVIKWHLGGTPLIWTLMTPRSPKSFIVYSSTPEIRVLSPVHSEGDF